jgi:hypothetical protein
MIFFIRVNVDKKNKKIKKIKFIKIKKKLRDQVWNQKGPNNNLPINNGFQK